MTHTSAQTPTAVVNQPPTLNPPFPPNEIAPHSPSIIDAAPLPPSQPIAPRTTITSVQSTLPGQIPLAINTKVNAVANAKLTDEQIDFVRSLWSANVPATDIARVMEYMREGREGSGQGSMGIDMTGDVKQGMAPPFDNAVYISSKFVPSLHKMSHIQPNHRQPSHSLPFFHLHRSQQHILFLRPTIRSPQVQLKFPLL
jgi:hypothetical protein